MTGWHALTANVVIPGLPRHLEPGRWEGRGGRRDDGVACAGVLWRGLMANVVIPGLPRDLATRPG